MECSIKLVSNNFLQHTFPQNYKDLGKWQSSPHDLFHCQFHQMIINISLFAMTQTQPSAPKKIVHDISDKLDWNKEHNVFLPTYRTISYVYLFELEVKILNATQASNKYPLLLS